jgi:hypothetical protein
VLYVVVRVAATCPAVDRRATVDDFTELRLFAPDAAVENFVVSTAWALQGSSVRGDPHRVYIGTPNGIFIL